MVNFVVKLGLVLVLCLLVIAPTFAYRIDNVAVGLATGVSADTVVASAVVRQLGSSLSIYGVWLTPSLTNSANQKIYIGGDNTLTKDNGYELTVTGGSVRIPVDNLNKIWVTGQTVGAKLSFIADVK